MAKQQISQKETHVGTIGKQLEHTLIVDDNSLPAPEDLSAYKAVDPDIVKFLMDTSRKEQEHRHKIDKEKIDILKKNENRTTTINVVGMMFAFLCIISFVALTGFALYLDRPWFAGFMGVGALFSLASVFIQRSGTNRR